MADPVLQAQGATEGLELPFASGAARLLLAQPAALVWVAPFKGQYAAVSAIVLKRIGAGLPDAGRFADGDEGRVLWAGHQHWVIAGTGDGLAGEMQALLAGKAAVTGQSDGWTLLALIGVSAREVMARLCPLDLSAEVFPAGSAARSEFAHMMALITAIPNGFGIMVMRSFTATAVHHIKDAMASVAAQAPLSR